MYDFLLPPGVKGLKGALKRFGLFWTPAANAARLRELAEFFRPRLPSDAQNRAFAKNGSCIQILDTTLPFISNAPFLYPLKTSENRKVFWCF